MGNCFDPIQDGDFRAAHDGREGGENGKKHPYLRSVTYILQWWNLAKLYLT